MTAGSPSPSGLRTNTLRTDSMGTFKYLSDAEWVAENIAKFHSKATQAFVVRVERRRAVV